MAAENAVNLLKEMSKPVTTPEEIAQVPTLKSSIVTSAKSLKILCAHVKEKKLYWVLPLH